MASERKPGSDRGRAVIDWAAAFVFYASLPPEQRSYQAVADRFAVSVRTVERHGRDDSWAKRVRELDESAREHAAERVRDARAQNLVDTEALIGASLAAYGDQLLEGLVKVTPADLARLHKLRTQLWDQQDSHTAVEPVRATETDSIDPNQRKLDVLRALDDAGVLEHLLRGGGDGRDDGVEDRSDEGERAA